VPTTYQLGAHYAAQRDGDDPLRSFRERFYIRPGVIYMDGNSLGLASRDAETAVITALQAWKSFGIDGWTAAPEPWFYLSEELGIRQGPLVGALPGEVVVTGTTTVNQHALVATFYDPRAGRTQILADELDFPSDIYALQSQIRVRGLDPAEDLALVRSRDGRTLSEADIIAAMTPSTALVVLPSVLYRSGQLLDMERLTAAAHEHGIPIGFDCSHSAGSVPHRLHDWGVDFAFWCGYKYLNGGPGAVGSLFVHQRHFGRVPGLAGWFGCRKDRQFDMLMEFIQAPSAGAWQISTPSVLSSAAVGGALQVFAEAGIDRIRAKSLDLTAYLMYLMDHLLAPYGCEVGTPREDAQRGGHVALEHSEAIRICKALKARGVLPDFRFPNVVRLAPVALYTSYREVWETIQILRDILESKAYEGFESGRDTVA